MDINSAAWRRTLEGAASRYERRGMRTAERVASSNARRRIPKAVKYGMAGLGGLGLAYKVGQSSGSSGLSPSSSGGRGVYGM